MCSRGRVGRCKRLAHKKEETFCQWKELWGPSPNTCDSHWVCLAQLDDLSGIDTQRASETMVVQVTLERVLPLPGLCTERLGWPRPPANARTAASGRGPGAAPAVGPHFVSAFCPGLGWLTIYVFPLGCGTSPSGANGSGSGAHISPYPAVVQPRLC